jgi:putative spermidine/putrescine transport system permease protein
MHDRLRAGLLIAPALAVFLAFFLIPLGYLAVAGGAGGYSAILTEPRFLRSLISTLLVAAATTVITLFIATIMGLFLARVRFRGRSTLLALLTLPLAFPGVVVGYLVIMLAGRQGLVAEVSMALGGDRIVFAYSLAGLLLGYVYFSIPRTLLTLMAAAEKLDPRLEEAARSLGASPFGVLRDVLLPGMAPALGGCWSNLLCHRDRRFWNRFCACVTHRCSTHGHLHGIHTPGEFGSRSGTFLLIGYRNLGCASPCPWR